MAYCIECGKENRSDATFCRYCGYRLEKPEDQAIELPGQGETHSDPGAAEFPPEMVALAEDGKPVTPANAPSGNELELKQDEPVMEIIEPANETVPGQTPIPLPPEESISSAPASQSSEEHHPAQIESANEGALDTGTILQERYRIIRPLSSEDKTRVYEVEDLFRCWSCQAVQAEKQSQFCEVCGAELTSKPIVHLHATLADADRQPESDTFVEGGYLYQIVVPTLISPDKKTEQVRHIVGYQSDTGKEREMDEDSLLVLQLSGICELRSKPIMGFFAVADGIGGHDAGEVASRVAVHALAADIMQQVLIPEANEKPLSAEELVERLKQTISTANQAILEVRNKSETDSDMGCTLTAALVRDMTAVVANVGDSRTYLMHNGKLSQVTKDHSIVGRMVEQGIIKPEEIYTHEKKGAIYRCLGDKPELEIDTFFVDMVPGDRLVLCCDGLWEMVRDPSIEDVLLECFDPRQACDRLIQLANLAGGEDNISVIVVNIQSS